MPARIEISKDFQILRSREFDLATGSKTDRGDDPDGADLQKQIELEDASVVAAIRAESRSDRMKVADVKQMASLKGMDAQAINRMVIEEETRARDALLEAESQVSEPAVDIQAIHAMELELAQKIEPDLTSPNNPHAQGYLYNPSYAGAWWSWNGESEERPSYEFWSGPRNMDVRAQAYGEGWYDSDYSQIHGYLAYRINPPFHGILRVTSWPWVHAWWSLYSNDTWYSSKYAQVKVNTWLDIHQDWWRSRQYSGGFSKGGDEVHPTQYGRIDSSYSHLYETNVAASNTVTIRVGVYAYCRGKGGGSHGLMDVRSGAGNYLHVPWVHWYLYR